MQTTQGNPMSASAARAMLNAIHSEGPIENARRVGGHLMAGLGVPDAVLADVAGW